MRKSITLFPVIAAYFFVLLFFYASISKVLDFENFQVQLAQSPLLSAYAGFISYVVIITELVICLLLCFPETRLIGLYGSLSLMSAFTIYIYLILNYSDFVPCSCGGILEELGWTEHLIFNVFCILVSLIGIYLLSNLNSVSKFRTSVSAFGASLLSAGVVLSLFLLSEDIIKKENNFTRRYLNHPIVEDKQYDLKFNSYYFAGSSNGKIFLGNHTAPKILNVLDVITGVITAFKVEPDEVGYTFRALKFMVKPPYFYLYDGSVPIIYRGRIGETKAKTISYRDGYFDEMVVMDSSLFAIRTQSSTNKNHILGTINVNKGVLPRLFISDQLLEKQQDGIFDSDGQLVSDDRNPDNCYYVYSYRNQILSIDKNLNLLRRQNTIDTNSKAKIKVVQLSDGKRKMSAPPVIVNKKTVVHQNLLFNESGVIGRYEQKKQWRNSSIIDIYNVQEPSYVGSFYVPDNGKNKMSHMLVSDKYLFVLSGTMLIRYHFTKNMIQKFKNGGSRKTVYKE
ncbi:DoxX family protein [Chryseobacterium sp. G0201]|uniref:DoxX family protein n=1 Tax=Chryseobacterium sp. G0201 TaxID=2487065 RepID=UPI000F5045D9|nr:MauE/DoxX family redox-associated membrane protein [Chryseobacterium sp. G0201]AZA54524.1 tellurium resistance protein TerC [Chryseobacterium sp. G0201]